MEFVLGAVIIGGFGYFLYTRVKKAKSEKGGGGGGGSGPSDRPPTDLR